MLERILRDQAVGEANIFLSGIASQSVRISHLQTMLENVLTIEPTSISPNFLAFIINQIVNECLLEEAEPSKTIELTLKLCEILNHKTSLSPEIINLPTNFFDLFNKILANPISQDQLLRILLSMELFRLNDKVSIMLFQEWMTKILSFLNVSLLAPQELILILRNLNAIKQHCDFAEPIDPSFFAKIDTYIRETKIPKEYFTSIIQGTAALKPQKTSTKVASSPTLSPRANLQENPKDKKEQIYSQLTDLGLWPREGYFSNQSNVYICWHYTLTEAYNSVCKNPLDIFIKQQAIEKVRRVAAGNHRKLIISMILHNTTINEAFLDKLLFAFSSGENFLLQEPDSFSALLLAISFNSLPLFKFFVEKLNVRIINPPLYLAHPYIIISGLRAKSEQHDGLYDYIMDNYEKIADDTCLIATIRYQAEFLFNALTDAKIIHHFFHADRNGTSPLMHALKQTNGNANYFIDKLLGITSTNDLLNYKDKWGKNAFAYALEYGQVNYFFKFLARVREVYADFPIDRISLPNNDSSLLYALKHSQESMIEALIEAGCSFDQLDDDGLNLAHNCVEDPALTNALIWIMHKNPKLISNSERTYEGDTVLLYAARNQYFWALGFLILAGSDIHATNYDGMSLGHYLVINNQYVLLNQYLNQYNLNIMGKNMQAENLLDLAVKHTENPEIFLVCLNYLRNKNLPFDLKNQTYFYAILEYLAALPEEGKTFSDENGQTLIHLACLYGENDNNTINSLIGRHGFSVNTLNKQKKTPLYCLVKQQLTEKAIGFIERYSPRLTKLDSMDSSLLHLVCEMNNIELAERYISKLTKSILLARKPDGKSPLDLAFQSKNSILISLLWKHMTIKQQTTAFAKFKDNLQQERIEFALEQGYIDITAINIPAPIVLPVLPKVEYDQISPETIPVEETKTSITKAPVVYPSLEDVFTTISITRHIPTLRLIKSLQRKIDDAENPYFHELQMHSIAILECALKTLTYSVINQVLRFPCINENMIIGKEPAKRYLETALSSGRGSIIRQVLKLKSLREVVAEDDNQALFNATLNNQHDVVQALLRIDSVSNSILSANDRCFLMACKVGNLETIDLFLINPIIVQSLHISEALSIAIETNNLDLVCKLINVPSVKDSLSIYNVAHAVRQKNIDIFMLFIALEHIKSQIILGLDSNQCSLLKLALENACDEMVSMLLSIPEVAEFARIHNLLPVNFSVIQPELATAINPSWLDMPLIENQVVFIYPALQNLDDIYDASMNGRLDELNQLLGGFVFPPFFVQELYEILYLAVNYHQPHIVNYLLQIENLAKYTLSRVNHLTARAILKNDQVMLRTLMKNEVIKQHLSFNYNYPLRFAARQDAVAMAKILLEDDTVRENAQALNNKALRSAAEIGSINMVKLLLNIGSVRRQINIFQNISFRRAFQNGHIEVCLYLLQDPFVFKDVAPIESKYKDLLQSFISSKLRPFPDDLMIVMHNRLYLMLIGFCLKDPSKQFAKEILTLLQHPQLKKRAHLGITADCIQNELLILAKRYGHNEIVSYLLSLPQVSKIEEKRATLNISHNPVGLFFNPNISSDPSIPKLSCTK